MKIDTSELYLPIYEALASKVRLKAIELLSQKPMNIKELAEKLDLSSAIMTMHVKKLEKAGIIETKRVPGKGGTQKLCTLVVDNMEIQFPLVKREERKYHEAVVPVGHFTDYDVKPTCGLATIKKVIGYFDDPRYFLDPERVDAKIIWFSKGFIEYKIPNYLLSSQKLEELEISLELGSEAPAYNNDWPSDIGFYINGVYLGFWTSPGDFGGTRGKFTPKWWTNDLNQYGLLKVIRINTKGCYVDGARISDITIDDININRKQWTFRIATSEDMVHDGGVTIYGMGFGNYNQDIITRLYYT